MGGLYSDTPSNPEPMIRPPHEPDHGRKHFATMRIHDRLMHGAHIPHPSMIPEPMYGPVPPRPLTGLAAPAQGFGARGGLPRT